MKRRWVALFVALPLLLPALALAAPAETTSAPDGWDGAMRTHADRDGDRISDSLAVSLAAPDAPELISVIATFTDRHYADEAAAAVPGLTIDRELGLVAGFSATLDDAQIGALAAQPGLIRVEDNFTVSIANDGANRDFGTALARTDYGVDGTGVGICVVDTGIDPNHEQLDDPGKIAGWFDAISGSPNPLDDHGHGTHVSATAAGSGTGGSDAATYKGVAPGATLYGAKVLNASGISEADSVEQGVAWCAAQEGVDIISMSLGSGQPSDGLDVLSLTVNAAADAGKIVIVAAGNSGDGPYSVGSPGAAEKAITVGAVAEWSVPSGETNHSDGAYLAPFSSRGPTLAELTKPDIASPGVSITSAAAGTGSGYETHSGTSMATPFTSGTVALMLEADPALTWTDVLGLMEDTAIDRGPAGKDNHWGWGLIDGYALVAEASSDTEYDATEFPAYAAVPGSVAGAGLWSYDFEITAADLEVPIAATILLEGEPVCVIDLGPLGCLIWEWGPDLEARLRDPSTAVLAQSECPAIGDCGLMGQQETLHAMPTTPGTYTIEVWSLPEGEGGDFTVYLSTGPAPTSTSGWIAGMVTDIHTGKPLEGIDVDLHLTGGGALYAGTTTATDGSYVFAVPIGEPGAFDVHITDADDVYLPEWRYDVAWTVGATTDLDVQMRPPFSDIAGHWAYEDILAIYRARITTGYPDWTFRPNNTLNRAETVTFIIRALDESPTSPSTDPFLDVPTTHWAAGYIERAVQLGLTTGYGDGTFRPDQAVTRAEIAVFIVRGLGETPTVPTTDPFLDVPKTHWAAGYIERLVQLGIITGYPDGTYRPNNIVTRGEMSALVNRGFLE